MSRIIPIVTAESLIPAGIYCYTRLPESGVLANANRGGPIRLCPFWDKPADKVAEFGDQGAGYCAYLKVGDWMDDGTLLLWDQCKECGINCDDENDE